MILEKVKRTIQKYNLFRKGDKVLIAYSGGVDSTALLSLLKELMETWSIQLFIAHFNHQLRSRSEEDEEFVRKIAQESSLPLIVGREDVRSYAREKALNLEEAGRRLRYAFLRKAAEEYGASKIATGHTMSDQAETLLMRLMRGSGSRGLGGIYPAVEGIIIRPLIQVERREIEAYLEGKRLPFRVDESNFDRRFLRNRIRLDLIPYIQEKYEPRIVQHLSRLAFILQEEDDFLENIAREKADSVLTQEGGQILLNMKFLSSLPLTLRRRIVRRFISELKGNLREVSFLDVESVLELGEGKELHVKKNLVLRKEKGLVYLKKNVEPSTEYELLWKGEGELEIKELGLRFKGERREKGASLPFEFHDESRAFLDWSKLKFPLLVRNRKKGDKYQPLGAPGRKKLKEIMRAKGIPLSDRDKRPVFISGGDIVWVLGLPISESFRIEEKTKEFFLIQKL